MGSNNAAFLIVLIKTIPFRPGRLSALAGHLLHGFLEERCHPVKRDHIPLIIQIGMHRPWDDEQFFIAGIGIILYHIGKRIPAKVAGVGFLPMDEQNGAADLMAVLQDRLIHKRHASRHVPAAVGI